jgi:predicted O-linked N-acetylglucosamine transferase (SPINDLY family)
MGASILLHMGLGGLVAESEEAYVDLAIRLASDADARAHAADEVATRFAAAAASFPTRYTRDLEAALDAARATTPGPPA